MTCPFCCGVGWFWYKLWRCLIPDQPEEVKITCDHCDGKGYVYQDSQEDGKCVA